MVQHRNHIGLHIKRRNETDFLTQIIRASWGVLSLAVVYQLIFFYDIANFVALSTVTIVWIIATKIWLRAAIVENYPLSTFIILGFVSTQFFFPLLFTTIENKPLVYNLELPEQVFLHCTAAFLVLSMAHYLYRLIMKVTPNRSFSILGKAGFFDPPSYLQIWLMGLIGLASSFYVYFAVPDVGREVTGEASDKFLQALSPFTYAPFLIPLSKLWGNHQKPSKGFIPKIILYAALLLAISVARNSRAAFIESLTNPAFAYTLGLLLGAFRTRLVTFRNVVIVALGTWLLIGPLSDLGTAMLIARDKTKDFTAMEKIERTIDAFNDKQALRARTESDLYDPMDFDWDERYLDNIFTARFANLKFNDASLITYSKVGKYNPDMQDFSADYLWASLPDPAIKLFKIDIDKEQVLSGSFGDRLYILSGGFGTPEGFRVGHIAGTGMATFGWWYLLLFGAVVIPIFYLIDKFFRIKGGIANSPTLSKGEKFQFSFCGLLALTGFFQFLLFESVISGATFLTRGWIQMVALYFIIFHITHIFSRMFQGRWRKLKWSSN